MKAVWEIFRADLSRAHRSVISMVVVLGLVVLPSFFAWFNISASWDPFANTKNLRIAIANTDKGYKSDLIPLEVNIGNRVVSALRTNEQFNWVIDSEEQAIEKTRSGEYYAAVVIPPDFSQEMLTFFSSDAHSTPLTYYINEKKNGLAPKIAGQGAERVSSQINQVFARTVAEIAVDTASSLSDSLSDPTNVRGIQALNSRLESTSQRLNAAATSADAYAGLIASSVQLVDSTQTMIASASKVRDPLESAANNASASVDQISAGASQAASALSSAVSASAQSLEALSASIDDVYSRGGSSVTSAVATLRSQASSVGNQSTQYLHVKETLANLPGTPISQDVLDRLQASADRLSALQNAINKLADDMEKNVADAGANHQDVKNLVGQAQSAISSLKSDVDSTLRPQLERLSGTINSATSSMENLRAQLSAASSSVNDGSNGVREGLSKLQSTFSGIGTQLREASQKIADIHNKLNDALESGNLAKVRTIIGSDPQALAVALAAPVGVTTIPVYPVDNFGSQMAPFYTALALWVGSVLMIITIRSDVTTENVVEGLDSSHPAVGYFKRHHLGLWEGFLGRYLIFGLIALTQATILSLGLLFFVKIQHVHPWLFMFTAWAIALVFSFLLYTFIATFGNAGKALGVLFLVLQITGAGGSFPLAILPDFFRSISPYLPATHGITALRAAIAGYSGGEYVDAMLLLGVFVLVAALLGFGLRPLLIKRTRLLVEKLESTKLM
jgi:yhgE/pip C-terminal domain